MKIKRFFAKTIRGALQQVREEQGPDSVILSNRQVTGGIEVIAAVDYDEALLHQTYGRSAFASNIGGNAAAGLKDELADPLESKPPAVVLAEPGVQPQEFIAESAPGASPVPKIAADPSLADPGLADTRLADVCQELKAMRSVMQHQLSQLTWNDLQRRQPQRAAVIRRLTLLGLDAQIIESLLNAVAQREDHRNVWRGAIGLLAKRLPLTTRDICETGGIYALVGPTGVGKTTSIAKLATRFALRHGAENLGLVTTDGFRIGAQEHLFRFGKILGVPVQVATDRQTLHSTLKHLQARKLVLIDTAGYSQRDPSLIERLSLTTPANAVRTLLTLSANTQTESLRETIRVFGRLELDGVIVTKLDEATSLGGLLSVIINASLQIFYVADGQRIPEDIRRAGRFRAELISRAVLLTKQYASGVQGARAQDARAGAQDARKGAQGAQENARAQGARSVSAISPEEGANLTASVQASNG